MAYGRSQITEEDMWPVIEVTMGSTQYNRIKLLQALIELAERGGEERSLLESVSNHVAARGVDKPAQPTLFDGELFAGAD